MCHLVYLKGACETTSTNWLDLCWIRSVTWKGWIHTQSLILQCIFHFEMTFDIFCKKIYIYISYLRGIVTMVSFKAIIRIKGVNIFTATVCLLLENNYPYTNIRSMTLSLQSRRQPIEPLWLLKGSCPWTTVEKLDRLILDCIDSAHTHRILKTLSTISWEKNRHSFGYVTST